MDPPLLPSLPPLHGAAKDRVTNACKVFFQFGENYRVRYYGSWTLSTAPYPLPPPHPRTPPGYPDGPATDRVFLLSWKKVNVDRLLWMVFPLSYCHLSSFIHLHILQWWKKSHRLEISAVKFTKDIWNFHLWPRSIINICLCLSYYLSPALYNCSR